MAYGGQTARLRKYVAAYPHRTRNEIVHGAGVSSHALSSACANGVLKRHGKRGEYTYTLAENGPSALTIADVSVAAASVAAAKVAAKVAAASYPLPPKPNAATASALTHLQAARNSIAAEITDLQRKLTAIDTAIAACK